MYDESLPRGCDALLSQEWMRVLRELTLLLEHVEMGPSPSLQMSVSHSNGIEIRRRRVSELTELKKRAHETIPNVLHRILTASLSRLHDGHAAYLILLNHVWWAVVRECDGVQHVSSHRQRAAHALTAVLPLCRKVFCDIVHPQKTWDVDSATSVWHSVVSTRFGPHAVEVVMRSLRRWAEQCAQLGYSIIAASETVVCNPAVFIFALSDMAGKDMSDVEEAAGWLLRLQNPQRFETTSDVRLLFAAFVADVPHEDDSDANDSAEENGTVSVSEEDQRRHEADLLRNVSQRCKDENIFVVLVASPMPAVFRSLHFGVRFVELDRDSFQAFTGYVDLQPVLLDNEFHLTHRVLKSATVVADSFRSVGNQCVALHAAAWRSRRHPPHILLPFSGRVFSAMKRAVLDALHVVIQSEGVVPGCCTNWVQLAEGLTLELSNEKDSYTRVVMEGLICGCNQQSLTFFRKRRVLPSTSGVVDGSVIMSSVVEEVLCASRMLLRIDCIVH